MDYKTKIKIVTWNVRGLNERPKRLAIRQTMFLEKPDIICIQETKLSDVDNSQQKEICGRRLNEYTFLAARGTKGGMLLAWRGRRFVKVAETKWEFCLTVHLQDLLLNQTIQCTTVYGPTSPAIRGSFFQELELLKPVNGMPWFVGWDFNTTLEAHDRNSSAQDWRWPLAFANLINALNLQDIRMEGRRYTWANTRSQPAMAKLD